MKKNILIFILLILAPVFSWAVDSSTEWGSNILADILGYNQRESLQLGHYLTVLKSQYFGPIFFGVLFGVPALVLVHYIIIGPLVFSHDKKIYVFTVFNRIVHAIAGTSFILLVPTGLIIIFGSFFGGGSFVLISREIHAISTVLFIIAVVPMATMWFKRALFKMEDIKWVITFGGYLSKAKNNFAPAGKFNAGQKVWYWIIVLGGLTMIATGGLMFFRDFEIKSLTSLISHIDLLRLSAIVHNVIGVLILGFFIAHIYLAVFAIKGAIHSMIDGYKSEDELKNLHSTYYKELKEKDKK